QNLTRFVPADNVDLLATELINNVADSAASNADARADRIDLGIDACNRQLRAEPGFARHRFDLDDTLRHFGHFGLEETANEIGVTALKNDLHLVPRIADIHHEAADAIARLKLFAGNLLAARHEPFRAIDLDDQRPAFIPLRHAGDEVTLPLGKLFQQRLAFILAELLNHDLLGGLRRDTAKTLQRNDFAFATFQIAPQGDLAGQTVHLAAELFRIERVEVLSRR